MQGLSEQEAAIEKLPQNELNQIKRVVAVMSGKGGVGKSSVAAFLAILARRKALKVGILDADITGPSIPKMFGYSGQPEAAEFGIMAPASRTGIRLMSLNMFLKNEDDPVIWRGPIMASAVKQFWTDVVWGELDYLIVDLPPGTGDSPLTVMQSLPLDGIVMVTTPQDLASMVVNKAVKMAAKLEVPVLGLIENMSYVSCPKCGEHIALFGNSHAERFSEHAGVELLARLPVDPEFAAACDAGLLEDYQGALVSLFPGVDELLP